MHARLVKSSSDPRLEKNMKASANNNSELQELQTNSNDKDGDEAASHEVVGGRKVVNGCHTLRYRRLRSYCEE